MIKYVIVSLLLSLSTLIFCQQKEFDWLIGTWQIENRNSFEVWKNEGDFLSAVSFKIDEHGNKTMSEEIKLIKKGNDFYYVPDVVGPQGPIEFKITSFDTKSFTAENPEHDFPKKITYKKTDANRFEASVGDRAKTILYYFRKIK